MICKADQSLWTEEEQLQFLEELNLQYPDKIRFEHDGIYTQVCILKAKNYILVTEDGKMKVKGSALKDQKSPPKIKQFKEDIIKLLLDKKSEEDLVGCYNKYIKEVAAISDIRPWSKKMTVTEKTFSSERTNEKKVRDAIIGTSAQQGDKIYVFFLENENLCLVSNFQGDYSRKSLMKQLHSSTKIFKNVLNPEIFINYNLKKNQDKLKVLLDKTEQTEYIDKGVST
jgi:hypothetical protein